MQIPNWTKIKILVVGDVMLDRYWHGKVDRISPESPVPVVEVAEESERLGGAANVAANVVGLGADCRLLSIVGDDDSGQRISTLCHDSNIQAHFQTDKRIRTTEKLRIVARNQQLLRADFESHPTHEVLAASLEDFRQQVIDVDLVLVSDYDKGGLTHVQSMINIAKSHAKPVLIDPKGSDYGKYQGATLITPNLKEFHQAGGILTDSDSMANSARSLLAKYSISGLLVTRSEQGMTLYLDDGTSVHSPACAREVYDVSGAGDTVAAVFGVGIAAGMDYPALLDLANLAAGSVVSKFGTVAINSQDLKSAATNQERT